jgi:anaerobic magnesium-protoporphyrin IX monomethyl ester cyclase
LLSDIPRILLVYPPSSGARSGIRGIYYPLGVGYIAAALRSDYDVTIHDFNYDFCLGSPVDTDHMESVLKGGNYDILMIGGVFPRYRFIKGLIDASRKIAPKAKIVLGGSYIRPVLEVTARYFHGDCYVIGEGEKVAQKLADALLNGKSLDDIDGVAYQDGDNVRITNPPIMIGELDDIAFPDRSMLNFHHYKRYFALGYPLLYTAYVIASRGCPLNCVFCNPAFGRKVRVRSPENILAEVIQLQRDYNCRFIYFHDEVMLGGARKHIVPFCEEVLRKNIRFYWGGTTNPQMLNQETLNLMRRAGCIRISLGVESGSAAILKEMRKKNDLNHIKDIAAHCERIGIEMDFSLLTNTFSETEGTIDETKCYLQSFNDYFFRQPFSINFLLPIPGTDIYNMAKQKGLIQEDDLQNIMNMEDGSRYALKHNLTQFKEDDLIRLIEGVNRDLAGGYFRKHPLQHAIHRFTNLTHIRWRETITNLSPENLRAVTEGLLWALSRGNDDSAAGRIYKRMVYGVA